MNTRPLTRLTAIALAAGSLAVAGCSKADRDEAKARTDQAVETVKQKGSELAADTKEAAKDLKADVKEAAADARAKVHEMSSDAKDKSKGMSADAKDRTADMNASARDKTAELKEDASRLMDKAKLAVSDATITTSVKAELARDPGLKARDIDVDTSAGTVSLRGTAPSSEARERATSLATGVSGVVTVKNELTVAAKS